MKKYDLVKSKIITREKLQNLLTIWNFKEQKVVFTNGCFDILHRGHVEYLAKAASLGDVLIVGLNTDSSVRRLKGETRPVQDENSRAIILSALQFITHVVLFEENTPYELIKFVQPDILVKGSDYLAENIVGYDIVTAKGGQVVTIDLVQGYSTTGIVKKLQE